MRLEANTELDHADHDKTGCLRENGTGEADHGTGGTMALAGGAIRGGRVYGRWPGL